MTIIIALLLFGIIVLIHETGHFLLAKKNGVTVNEFSIGMGPLIYGKEKNNTLYSIRLLPLGGYVSMEGEDEDSSKPGSFNEKGILQRASIIFAGPFFNFLGAIGFLVALFLMIGTPTTSIDTIIDNSPAQKIGLMSGDEIKSINGNKIDSYNEVTDIIKASNGKELELTIERKDKNINLKLKPELNKETNTYLIGITFKRQKNVLKSFTEACTTTVAIGKQMVEFLGQLITGQVKGGIANSVAGPVGVIDMVSDAAKMGITNLLYLGAIISLNLGIINLVPFPALDGGRLLLLLLEGLRGGKKLDPKKEYLINVIGISALMAFTLFITYKDIWRLLTK